MSAWSIEGNVGSASFGWCVSGAGDVDGDGYDDVLVGAPSHSNPTSGEGRVTLYRGSANGLAMVAAWSFESGVSQAQLGTSVCSAVDIDLDGLVDVVLGAPGIGRCYVFKLSKNGLAATPHAILVAPDGTTGNLGRSVDGAGDVDGDGFADVFVGAPGWENSHPNEGRVLLYRGGTLGPSSIPAWTYESNVTGALLGSSVSGAGDVNGDGFADVIVGADSFNGGAINDGRAYSYRGSQNGLESIAHWTAQGDENHRYFGLAVAGGGDFDLDDLSDILVGGQNFDNGAQGAWAFPGCADRPTSGYYHPGKPTSWLPRLYTDAPVNGSTVKISFVGAKGLASGWVFVGLAPAEIPFDGGTLLVAPLLSVKLPTFPSNGNLQLSVTIPPHSTLGGIELFFHGIFIDPLAPGPHHTVQSNGVHWTIP